MLKEFLPHNTKDAWGKLFGQSGSVSNYVSTNRINQYNSARKLYPNSLRNLKYSIKFD